MKIKWLAGAKRLPTIGRVVEGQIFKCNKDVAESLIKQGLAEEVKKEVKKSTNSPDKIKQEDK